MARAQPDEQAHEMGPVQEICACIHDKHDPSAEKPAALPIVKDQEGQEADWLKNFALLCTLLAPSSSKASKIGEGAS